MTTPLVPPLNPTKITLYICASADSLLCGTPFYTAFAQPHEASTYWVNVASVEVTFPPLTRAEVLAQVEAGMAAARARIMQISTNELAALDTELRRYKGAPHEL